MEGSTYKFSEGLDNLNEALHAHLFNRIWRLKGSIRGIHSDFGRHAFFCTNEVPSCYHFGGEKRV